MRLLGRVERFRDRLQVDVRSLEAADEVDPAALVPAMRRDADELDGFVDFLAAEVTHAGLRAACGRLLSDARDPRAAAAAAGAPTRTTRTPAGCWSTPSASPRSRARRRSCTRGCAPTCCSPRRCCTISGARASSRPGRASRRPTRAGCSATCTWACGSSRSATEELDPGVRAELLHAIAVPPRRARGPHGRGLGALPREPARRRGGHPPGRRLELEASAPSPGSRSRPSRASRCSSSTRCGWSAPARFGDRRFFLVDADGRLFNAERLGAARRRAGALRRRGELARAALS